MRLPPRPSASVIIAVAVFLVLGLGLFGSTGHDDSHITYWAALALQRFGHIVNYNGERVEQSSSLAHVLLLALLGAITRVPLPTLGPLTSIAGGAVALALTGKLGRLVAPAAPRGAELLAGTTACFVYWGFGGLETTLFAAAALWLILACAGYLDAPAPRALAGCAAAMALFLLARPEAPLVLACTLAVVLVHAAYRRRWADPRERGIARALRPALLLTAVAGAESALLFGFRRLYFGAFFPNPVYTKATGIDVAGGLKYLWLHLFPGGLWVVVGLGLGLAFIARDAWREREPRFAAVLAGAFSLAYAGFILLTGGDWMTGGRFLAHVLPVVCVVTMVAVSRALPQARRARVAVAVLVLSNLIGVAALADGSTTGRPIWSTAGLRAQVDARVGPRGYGWFELANKVHLRDATIAAALVDVVSAIRAAKPDRQLLVMSSQAGMVAYYAFEKHHEALRFIDLCSLTTHEFRSCLPASRLERRQVGLQLHVDRYFREEEAIDAKCGTHRPDVVYGLGHRGTEAVLEKHGYTIVSQQHGRMPNQGLGKHLQKLIESDEFVAVDSALLEGVAFEIKPSWTWNIR